MRVLERGSLRRDAGGGETGEDECEVMEEW